MTVKINDAMLNRVFPMGVHGNKLANAWCWLALANTKIQDVEAPR
jgi:hypothetical protein